MKPKWCAYPHSLGDPVLLQVVDGRNYCPVCVAFIYIQVDALGVDSPLLKSMPSE